MKKSLVGLALLLGLGCGGGNEQEAQQQAEALGAQLQAQLNMAAEQAGEQAQQAAAAQAAAQAAAAQAGAAAGAAAAGASNFGTVQLAAGFVPDPHTASGTSGGSIDASTWQAGCNGFVTQQPDHLFVASTAFANLRVMAHSQGDVTLVVQKPDGTYVCNDDGEGTDPIVEAAFPAGTYKVWIGSYQAGTNSPYTLGFTELASVTAASLGG
ncbi:MAG: hypothetical protein H6724_17480 [Sandaracinus sp.]|nr:hypothetical protein [Sandaracinus sp.]